MIDEEKAKAEAAAEEDTKATLERLEVSKYTSVFCRFWSLIF